MKIALVYVFTFYAALKGFMGLYSTDLLIEKNNRILGLALKMII